MHPKQSNDLILKIKNTIERYDMISAGNMVFAGVSGGIDSMCMLRVLMVLSKEMKFDVKVCHFNHLLRNSESDEDEIFVREFCDRNGLSHMSNKGDVRSFAEDSGRGIEESARILRYGFLRECSADMNARIAVAHHMTDQFETVMFNLLRGSGTAGLSGIRHVSGEIIRPLLDCTKDEIEEFASDTGLEFRVDSTNLQAVCDRNRIRLNLLPVFQENFGRDVVQSVSRTSSLCRQDDDFINSFAAEIFDSARTNKGIPRDVITASHPAVASRLIRMEYERAKGNRTDLESKHVRIVLEYLRSSSGRGTLDLPDRMKAKLYKGHFYIERGTENA